ncbi:hypothetical protein [Aeromonas cavernicola]|uniref:Uncharacterized protein n=1 Tax=Aeromonas cavernicola TaxID=1006623 RepID=A0A2H9U2D9_9GAMM|nr:hypothetical protein [Aeromonas cavernicola]PJG58181.1 hypothetical protein CUC53_14245 [Aeromonas cavernicola]
MSESVMHRRDELSQDHLRYSAPSKQPATKGHALAVVSSLRQQADRALRYDFMLDEMIDLGALQQHNSSIVTTNPICATRQSRVSEVTQTGPLPAFCYQLGAAELIDLASLANHDGRSHRASTVAANGDDHMRKSGLHQPHRTVHYDIGHGELIDFSSL